MIQIIKTDSFRREEILPEPAEREEIGNAVRSILRDVKERGDEAVKYYTKLFDHAELTGPLTAGADEIAKGAEAAAPELLSALKRAAENIYRFHEKQKQNGYTALETEGIVVGQRVIPLKTVGIYVPGGTARYPSTVLMNCIPAKIAGVEKLLITTPPDRDGNVPPEILAAAFVAGADCIIKAGGAQAIGALAYGTQSIPRADKIVGPGNAYVAEAKRQIQGLADTDMIAGPSEILIVADDKNDPEITAMDLLSQAEHDKMAAAVLVTADPIAAAAGDCARFDRPERKNHCNLFDPHGDCGGKRNCSGASGALYRRSLRIAEPGAERRLCISGKALPRSSRGLLCRAESHAADGRHGPLLQSSFRRGFCKKVRFYLLYGRRAEKSMPGYRNDCGGRGTPGAWAFRQHALRL